MSVTIADCLELPSLKDASVVAGHKGLGKIVASVSVLECSEFSLLSSPQLFRANEIVLTAFFAVRDDIPAQRKTIEMLHDSGNVALVLYYLGYFFPALDQQVIEAADELDFPLIVMPANRMDLLYSEVIGEIMEAIFRDRQSETLFVNHMLERISQLPEWQKTLDNVMQMLADQLKCTLLLTDASLKCYCFVKRPTSSSLTEDQVLNLFREKEFSRISRLAGNAGHSQVTAFRVPLSGKHLRLLSLLAIDESGRLSKEAVDQAVELLQLFSSIWNYDLEALDPEALVPAILGNNMDQARNIAEAFRIDLSALDTMLLFRPEDTAPTLQDKVKRNEILLSILRKETDEYEKTVICGFYCGVSVVIAELSGNDVPEDTLPYRLIDRLREFPALAPPALYLNQREPEEFRRQFSLYQEYFNVARTIYPQRTWFSSAELEFTARCCGLIKKGPENSQEYQVLQDCLAPLRHRENGSELLDTLAVYLLDTESSTRRTGELMFLHKNTILYRLGEIRKVLRCDLIRMPEAYRLYQAAALYRLTAAQAEE